MIFVVDENVPIVANEASKPSNRRVSPQADDSCILASIEKLEKIIKRGVVVLDDAGEVISSYRQRLSAKGMPGTGDAFLRHLSYHQYNESKVKLIHIAKNQLKEYEIFPDDPSLGGFDRDDRKFVALALSADAVIINAVDSDYSEYKSGLDNAGVKVDEICPQCLKAAG